MTKFTSNPEFPSTYKHIFIQPARTWRLSVVQFIFSCSANPTNLFIDNWFSRKSSLLNQIRLQARSPTRSEFNMQLHLNIRVFRCYIFWLWTAIPGAVHLPFFIHKFIND
jgi:hypothetical protein